MRLKRIYFLFLCFYLFQIVFVPISHHIFEGDEESDCSDCHFNEQLNSSCGDGSPCENPSHHHHGKHKSHDSANCVVCKIFLQNIEISVLNSTNYYQHIYSKSLFNKIFVSYLFYTSFSNRSPPSQIS